MKVLLPLFLLAALTACRKEPIEVRTVPKEDAPAPASDMAPAERARGVRWTAPSGWKELAGGGGGMRVATFELPKINGKVEATVVALPGDVGGELANVNRWRGQLALAPIAQEDLAAARATVKTDLGALLVYDFTGTGEKKTRLVAGMIQVSGTTWFFKLMGEEKAVAAARPAFLKLLRGLKTDAP